MASLSLTTSFVEAFSFYLANILWDAVDSHGMYAALSQPVRNRYGGEQGFKVKNKSWKGLLMRGILAKKTGLHHRYSAFHLSVILA